jgi:hypothetical protein
MQQVPLSTLVLTYGYGAVTVVVLYYVVLFLARMPLEFFVGALFGATCIILLIVSILAIFVLRLPSYSPKPYDEVKRAVVRVPRFKKRSKRSAPSSVDDAKRESCDWLNTLLVSMYTRFAHTLLSNHVDTFSQKMIAKLQSDSLRNCSLAQIQLPTQTPTFSNVVCTESVFAFHLDWVADFSAEIRGEVVANWPTPAFAGLPFCLIVQNVVVKGDFMLEYLDEDRVAVWCDVMPVVHVELKLTAGANLRFSNARHINELVHRKIKDVLREVLVAPNRWVLDLREKISALES